MDITIEQINQIRNTIFLLNSMVLSGEDHSPGSIAEVKQAAKNIAKLQLAVDGESKVRNIS